MSELKGIDKKGGTLVIGAMATHAEVAGSEVVRGVMPALCFLAGMIGDPHVRHRGTIGGSVANNDPAADYPAALLALGATVATNKREIEAEAFFKGMFSTALKTARSSCACRSRCPPSSPTSSSPTRRPAMPWSAWRWRKTGKDVRVAVTGAGGSGVFRHKATETALAQGWSAQALASVATSAAEMMSDIHGDAEYRAHLVGVLARRAVTAAG